MCKNDHSVIFAALNQNQSQHLNEFLLVWNRLSTPTRLDGDSCGGSREFSIFIILGHIRGVMDVVLLHRTVQNLFTRKKMHLNIKNCTALWKPQFSMLFLEMPWCSIFDYSLLIWIIRHVCNYWAIWSSWWVFSPNISVVFVSEAFAHLTFKCGVYPTRKDDASTLWFL